MGKFERLLGQAAERHPWVTTGGILGTATIAALLGCATMARAQEDPTGARFEAGMLDAHPDSRTVREYVQGIGCLIGWDLDVPENGIVSDGIVDRVYNPNGDQFTDNNHRYVPYQYVPSISIADFRTSDQMPVSLMEGAGTNPNHWWWMFESDIEPDLHLPINGWRFQQRMDGTLPRVAPECEEQIS